MNTAQLAMWYVVITSSTPAPSNATCTSEEACAVIMFSLALFVLVPILGILGFIWWDSKK